MKVLLFLLFLYLNVNLVYNYNPDVDLDVPQLIRRHGYPSESHLIVTEDGYILRMHRIAGSQTGSNKGNQPVFLQHGLFGSSADWIMNGNESLGFLLADEGYDVWMGNARGNYYSTAHVSLSTSSPQYWNFSWNEMGTKDLPAALYHVSNETNRYGEILYVGHSMGTTQFFVFASMLPQVAKNVKLMTALAPTAFMAHIRSPIRYLTPFVYDFEWLAKYLDLNQFLPRSKLLELLAYDCRLFKYERKICDNLVFLFLGFDKNGFNTAQIPVILGHDPAGASTRTVLHYAQEIKKDGIFRQWDWGSAGNQIAYGQPTPPEYNVTNIKRPLYFMYAANDILASPADVKYLAKKVSATLVDLYLVPNQTFDHVDFIFGKDAPQLVYKPLIKVLKKYTKH